MDRRQLVRLLASAAGITALDGLSPMEAFGLGRTIHARPVAGVRVLDAQQRAALEVAAERIIPGGDSPGATDAHVASFIEKILADWYDAAERERFLGGLADLDSRARARHSRGFVDCAEPQQFATLRELDDEVVAQRRDAGAAANDHPFAMLKFLTAWGYCTSEVAMRAYGEYPQPMRYDGCAVLPGAAGTSAPRGYPES